MKNDIRDPRNGQARPCCGSSDDAARKIVDENTAASIDHAAEALFLVSGMHCGACAVKIRETLSSIEGVTNAEVSLKDATARVHYDPGRVHIEALGEALSAAGYAAHAMDVEPGWLKVVPTRRPPIHWSVWGAVAALGVIGFYLGLITLTSDWPNALYQFGQYGGWVIALAIGLGVQVGFFVHMRAALARARLKGAASGMAASGGVSGVAMALCCSHYLAAVLPALGLPFFSGAVAGLVDYQTPFFVIGVVSNLLGIAYMLRLMMKNGLVIFNRPLHFVKGT